MVAARQDLFLSLGFLERYFKMSQETFVKKFPRMKITREIFRENFHKNGNSPFHSETKRLQIGLTLITHVLSFSCNIYARITATNPYPSEHIYVVSPRRWPAKCSLTMVCSLDKTYTKTCSVIGNNKNYKNLYCTYIVRIRLRTVSCGRMTAADGWCK